MTSCPVAALQEMPCGSHGCAAIPSPPACGKPSTGIFKTVAAGMFLSQALSAFPCF